MIYFVKKFLFQKKINRTTSLKKINYIGENKLRKNKTSLFIFGLSITLVIFFSIGLHSQMIGNSINGNANGLIPRRGDSDELYALNGSFNVTQGLSWLNEITVLDDTFLDNNLTVGDRIRFTITEINSSTVNISGSLNTGETVFAKSEYFNSTSGDWNLDENQSESLLSIYNGTDSINLPFMPGTYNWYTPLIEIGMNFFHTPYYDCLPSDFSAANHTIVNSSYVIFLMSGSTTFNFNYTTSGNLSIWNIWNGTAGNNGSEPNSYRMVHVFNNMGVCTLSQFYINGTSWDLVFEIKNLRMGPAYPFDFGNIIGNYKYNVTVANNSANFPIIMTAGDTIYNTIQTIIPNFDLGSGDFADTALGIWEYINSTDGSNETSPVVGMASYNKTNSFDVGIPCQYMSVDLDAFFTYFQMISFNFIPLDFFAVNHTIINFTRFVFRMGDPATVVHYNYSQDLSTNNIAGTWTVWNGTAGNDGTEPGTILATITFNSQGVRTIQRMYQSGASGWELILEIVLQEPYIVSVSRDPSSPSNLDSVNVSVHISDTEGVDTVLINSNHTGTPLNYEMNFLSGSYQDGYWNYTIPACSAGSIITYSIWANDTSNNTDTAGPYQYLISAIYPYDFGNILGTYTYRVTAVNPVFYFPVVVGDMFYGSVINILRDVDLGAGDYADVANGTWSYYNSTDYSTTNYTDVFLSVYNHTHSFNSPFGIHHYVTVLTSIMMNYGIMNFNFLPLDFFAANETIVNVIHTVLIMSDPASECHYSFTHDLSTTSIAGTWNIWNGTAANNGTEPGTYLLSFTFNSNGILTLERMYVNGTSDWELILELTLIKEEGGEAPLGLLLAALTGGGGDMGMMILIIAVIAGIAIAVISIAIVKAKK